MRCRHPRSNFDGRRSTHTAALSARRRQPPGRARARRRRRAARTGRARARRRSTTRQARARTRCRRPARCVHRITVLDRLAASPFCISSPHLTRAAQLRLAPRLRPQQPARVPPPPAARLARPRLPGPPLAAWPPPGASVAALPTAPTTARRRAIPTARACSSAHHSPSAYRSSSRAATAAPRPTAGAAAPTAAPITCGAGPTAAAARGRRSASSSVRRSASVSRATPCGSRRDRRLLARHRGSDCAPFPRSAAASYRAPRRAGRTTGGRRAARPADTASTCPVASISALRLDPGQTRVLEDR